MEIGQYDITQYQPLKTSLPPSSFAHSYRPIRERGGVSLDAEPRRWTPSRAVSHVVPSELSASNARADSTNRIESGNVSCVFAGTNGVLETLRNTSELSSLAWRESQCWGLLARTETPQRKDCIEHRPTVARKKISIGAERRTVGSDWRWKRPTLISLVLLRRHSSTKALCEPNFT